MSDHPRVIEPAPNVLAFYDGRVEGYRFDPSPNWVDEGALGLGIASYAILSGDEALVCDTGVSVEHGAFVRAELGRRGAARFTVVLSHWHLDHVAGTEAFEVELIEANVHSDDATVPWLPDRRLLLCGDTMEDTVTYVDRPQEFDTHLRDLERLRELEPDRILPAHGDPDQIAAGGYPAGLNDATQAYIRLLQRMPAEPDLRDVPLRELIADPLERGRLIYFEPYEAVHRQNVTTVLEG